MPTRKQSSAAEANLRNARANLTWARERCAVWSERAAEKIEAEARANIAGQQTHQEKRTAAAVATLVLAREPFHRAGETLDAALEFLDGGNLSAALAVVAGMLANLVGLMPDTIAGMDAGDARRKGGAASYQRETDERLARELAAIGGENPTRFPSPYSRARERARRMYQQREDLTPAEGAERERREVQRVMKRVQRDRRRRSPGRKPGQR